MIYDVLRIPHCAIYVTCISSRTNGLYSSYVWRIALLIREIERGFLNANELALFICEITLPFTVRSALFSAALQDQARNYEILQIIRDSFPSLLTSFSHYIRYVYIDFCMPLNSAFDIAIEFMRDISLIETQAPQREILHAQTAI